MTNDTTKEVIYFSARNRKFAFLTNEYSCTFTIDGKEYWHMEGYFQSQKFTGINNKAEEHVRTAFSPTSCKKIATTYRVTPEREEFWDGELQDVVMMRGLITKFTTNSKLAKLLINTGDKKLLYANTTDEYWGIGSEGKGANELGTYLMEVRKIMKQVYTED